MSNAPHDYDPRTAYKCELCQDVGSIVTRTDSKDRRYGRVCSCLSRDTALARIEDLAKDWDAYRDAYFENFTPANTQQEKIVTAMKDHPQRSFLIIGGVGVGKTHLLISQAKERIKQNGPFFWIGTEHQLSLLLRNIRHGKKSAPWETNSRYHFFLDDLGTVGAQDGQHLAHLGDVLNTIINRDGWALTITTNLDVERLTQEYGARIARRVLDKCTIADLGDTCGLSYPKEAPF